MTDQNPAGDQGAGGPSGPHGTPQPGAWQPPGPSTGPPPGYGPPGYAPPPGYGPPGYGPPGYGPPGYGPPGYGPQPGGYGGYPPPQGTNGLAVASLVLGILWIYWLGSILALVFGYIARKQIRERGDSGAGLAVAGIVLGWVGVGVLLVIVVFGVVARTSFGP